MRQVFQTDVYYPIDELGAYFLTAFTWCAMMLRSPSISGIPAELQNIKITESWFVRGAGRGIIRTFVFYLASCIDMRSERVSHCHHYDHSLLMHINRAQVSFTSPPPHRRPFVQPWRRFRRNLFLLPFATLSSTPHLPTDIAICCLPAFFSVRGYSTYDAYTTGSC